MENALNITTANEIRLYENPKPAITVAQGSDTAVFHQPDAANWKVCGLTVEQATATLADALLTYGIGHADRAAVYAEIERRISEAP